MVPCFAQHAVFPVLEARFRRNMLFPPYGKHAFVATYCFSRTGASRRVVRLAAWLGAEGKTRLCEEAGAPEDHEEVPENREELREEWGHDKLDEFHSQRA